MFSRSKNKAKPKVDENVKKERVKQFLIDVPEMPGIPQLDQDDDNAEYDSDLEAELLALTQGTGIPISKGKKSKKPNNLNQMIDECMRDDDANDQLSDEDDIELLAELSALATEGNESMVISPEPTVRQQPLPDVQRPAPVINRPAPVIARPAPMAAGPSLMALLKDRRLMYEDAEKNAIEAGETARAKRFKRGLGTVNQMLRTVESGRPINEDDIPPSVLVSTSRAGSNADLSQTAEKSDSVVPSPDSLSPDVTILNIVGQPTYQNNQVYSPSGSVQPNLLPDITNISSHQSPLVPVAPPRTVMPPPQPRNVPEVPSASCSQASITVCQPGLTAVTQRQLEYKTLALEAKKKGDIEEAMRLLKVAKQMQPLVDAAKEGKEIDINSLPPNPSNPVLPQPLPKVVEPPLQQAGAEPIPTKPLTTLEALQQRMAFYEQQRNKAKADENARKERMNQRITKQYQEAITQVKTGRLIDFTELPSPPGFPPIPVPGSVPAPSSTPAPVPVERTPDGATPGRIPPRDPSDGPSPKQMKPSPVSAGSASKVQATTANVRNAPKSRVERQLSILQKRQQLFREAALESKKRGEMEQAKEYLRNSKGFDQLILASQGGLPVDMNTAPVPPQEVISSFSLVADFELVGKEDCEIMPAKNAADMAVTYTKLEDDLISQIKMCARTREHFKAVGDVASANRFEQLILHSKKDLDSVRAAFKRGDSPPRFHYETRSFTMIQCNTDLNDSDLEFIVVRGINYNVPNAKEVDTYVKVEFPYPTDAPPQDKTDVVKDTNCPEYNHKFLFSIDRKSRSVSRVFKRQSVKCQIINKGSWYHRDSVLGTVKVPLSNLENKCTHHNSYDLADDRKKMVGGKLEVKVRTRNPILTKQLEKISEKWLVLDGF